MILKKREDKIFLNSKNFLVLRRNFIYTVAKTAPKMLTYQLKYILMGVRQSNLCSNTR